MTTSIMPCGMKLPIHDFTSTVFKLIAIEVGAWVFIFHYFTWMWLSIHAQPWCWFSKPQWNRIMSCDNNLIQIRFAYKYTTILGCLSNELEYVRQYRKHSNQSIYNMCINQHYQNTFIHRMLFEKQIPIRNMLNGNLYGKIQFDWDYEWNR